jgi:hypothetical protein
MPDVTRDTFTSLFKEAYKKCFGINLLMTMSETESRHFSNTIFEQTGLVIGAKSLKNYAFYILNPVEAKPEKPSVATLDTLARYVLNAPYTNEIERKNKEGHFPFWFEYRNKNTQEAVGINSSIPKNTNKKAIYFLVAAIIITTVLISIIYLFPAEKNDRFTEDFHTVAEDSLLYHGWFLKDRDETWWKKRNELPSHITLYTLKGDNWADSAHAPVIKNLLLRKISSACFTTEIHFDHFVPRYRWQQAGLIFLEDTVFSGKSLRVSIGYNDFFGGYSKPKEIIVQAISSDGSSLNNPEEITHLPLFTMEPGLESLVAGNLQKSALRIEKNGKYFRILYATGTAENFAFKEALSKDLAIEPKFIGLFALQGFVNETDYSPAYINFFSLVNTPCIK